MRLARLVVSAPVMAWLETEREWPGLALLDLVQVRLYPPGLRALVAALADRGVRVVGLLGQTEIPDDRQAAQLPPLLEEVPAPLVAPRGLRSGQSLQHAGDIVVLGGVASGAEVLAGGSVFVGGKLSGRAQAGADGVICATAMDAEFLRIGTALQSEVAGAPVCATLVDGMVMVRAGAA